MGIFVGFCPRAVLQCFGIVAGIEIVAALNLLLFIQPVSPQGNVSSAKPF